MPEPRRAAAGRSVTILRRPRLVRVKQWTPATIDTQTSVFRYAGGTGSADGIA